MKNTKIFNLFGLLVVSLYSINVVAQDDKALENFETKEVNEFAENITSKDSAELEMQPEVNKSVSIGENAEPNSAELESKNLDEKKQKYEGQQATRYFESPSGYSLKPGEIYYQNFMGMYNQVNAGITKNISISVGTLPMFLFGNNTSIVWIFPKFSIPIIEDLVNLSLGLFAVTIFEKDYLGNQHTSYADVSIATLTIGNRDNNFSIGAGRGYSSVGGYAKQPLLTLSGMVKVSNKGYIITDNYSTDLGNYKLTILTAGYRIMLKRANIDLGILVSFEKNELGQVFPIIGFAVPLNKSRK